MRLRLEGCLAWSEPSRNRSHLGRGKLGAGWAGRPKIAKIGKCREKGLSLLETGTEVCVCVCVCEKERERETVLTESF